MGFFDTDFGSPIPWMADVPVDEWHEMAINLTTLEAVESEVPFGEGYSAATGGMGKVTEATAEMRVDGQEEASHTIPFWACGPLQEFIVASYPKRTAKLKWINILYRRSVVMRKGKENSKAEFSTVD